MKNQLLYLMSIRLHSVRQNYESLLRRLITVYLCVSTVLRRHLELDQCIGIAMYPVMAS